MSTLTVLFFELIQISLGNRKKFSIAPTDEEWALLFELSCKHSIAALLFEGITVALQDCPKGKPYVFYEWYTLQLQTVDMNRIYNARAKELCSLLSEAGFRACILKGQGTALYYGHPEYRQCGDVDIWVGGERDAILSFTKKKGFSIGHIDIKHADIGFFDDVPVEVHFLPSWMYSPFTNKKLQRFFRDNEDRQFSNFDASSGFVHTTSDFDIVYSLVHIYRHIFSEGIGLRQLVDYYYILLRSTSINKESAYKRLKGLGLSSFAGGIMWILKECFAMKEELLLCSTNEFHGKFLLSEMLAAGNFGKYDERRTHSDASKLFKYGFIQLKRNIHFVRFYPSEVLWSVPWKLWHYCWRKRRGYL